MPFYEYECSNCKFYTELLQKVSDPPLKKCPSCRKATMKKLVSAPVFRLKGGGWYETDFKSDKDKKRNLVDSDGGKEAGAEKAADKPAEKPVEKEKSADKPDSKPAAKAESASGGSGRKSARRVAKPAAKAPARRPAARPARGKAKR